MPVATGCLDLCTRGYEAPQVGGDYSFALQPHSLALLKTQDAYFWFYTFIQIAIILFTYTTCGMGTGAFDWQGCFCRRNGETSHTLSC